MKIRPSCHVSITSHSSHPEYVVELSQGMAWLLLEENAVGRNELPHDPFFCHNQVNLPRDPPLYFSAWEAS